jgi:hypothetical protein
VAIKIEDMLESLVTATADMTAAAACHPSAAAGPEGILS